MISVGILFVVIYVAGPLFECLPKVWFFSKLTDFFIFFLLLFLLQFKLCISLWLIQSKLFTITTLGTPKLWELLIVVQTNLYAINMKNKTPKSGWCRQMVFSSGLKLYANGTYRIPSVDKVICFLKLFFKILSSCYFWPIKCLMTWQCIHNYVKTVSIRNDCKTSIYFLMFMYTKLQIYPSAI